MTLAANPYHKLYIYEISGELALPLSLTMQHFMGCWREGECSYLFFTESKEGELKKFLGKSQEDLYLSETIINYEDWEAGNPLTPLRVGRFYLCPLWEQPEPGPEDHLIWIDPGVAFGSGFHPTTKMCLQLINEVYTLDSLPTVVDFGTGTGILSLACLALGAQKVLAVDHNNLAISTAQKNARHNNREDHINFVCGDVMDYSGIPADLVLANTYYAVLRELLAQEDFCNKKWYILSGLIGAEIDKIKTQLQDLPLEIVKILDENFWFAVLARHL
jgi:ribosomal protein L11 methyltransferase